MEDDEDEDGGGGGGGGWSDNGEEGYDDDGEEDYDDDIDVDDEDVGRKRKAPAKRPTGPSSTHQLSCFLFFFFFFSPFSTAPLTWAMKLLHMFVCSFVFLRVASKRKK
jgi:hypothetical protein